MPFLEKIRKRIEEEREKLEESFKRAVEERRKRFAEFVTQLDNERRKFEEEVAELPAAYAKELKATLANFSQFVNSQESSVDALISLPGFKMGVSTDALKDGLRLKFDEQFQKEREEEDHKEERFESEATALRQRVAELESKLEIERTKSVQEVKALKDEQKNLKSLLLENDVAYIWHTKWGYSVTRGQKLAGIGEFDVIGKKVVGHSLDMMGCECKRYTMSPVTLLEIRKRVEKAQKLYQEILKGSGVLFDELKFQFWIISTAGFEEKKEAQRIWDKLKLVDLEDLKQKAQEEGYKLTSI